jgi:hypothetical protein
LRALFDRTSSSLQPSRALCFGHAALAAPDPADRADADCCSHRRPNDCWRKSGTCSDGLDCVYHSTRSRTRGRRTATGPMPVPPVRADARGAPAAGARRRLAVDVALSKAATSASTACASSARAPLRHRSSDRQNFLVEQEGTVGHGVSLLLERWRRQAPHDTPPYPFMPSPTFAHGSSDPVPGLQQGFERPNRASYQIP